MTAVGKIVTAQLKPGDRILVDDRGSFLVPSARKTGDRVKVATVTRLTAVTDGGSYTRQRRRYEAETDIGTVDHLAPSQTFWKAKEA